MIFSAKTLQIGDELKDKDGYIGIITKIEQNRYWARWQNIGIECWQMYDDMNHDGTILLSTRKPTIKVYGIVKFLESIERRKYETS